MSSVGPKRDWKDARAKVEAEGQCRVCGRSCCLEAAHLTGREHDPKKGSVRYVRPESIIPLCGSQSPEWSCHVEYDAHRLDLLSHLTLEEELRVVEDTGSLISALRRVAPNFMRESERSPSA